MLKLKANKTSLYNLVAVYKPLPGMRRVDFQKANGRPDYWLEWTTDDGHTKAFLSSSLRCPILTITTHDAAGGKLYHEAHNLSIEGLRGAVYHITSNAVCPGNILTPMGKTLSWFKMDPKTYIPLGRYGTAEDIANAGLFYASDLSDYVTGDYMNVNGGLYM